jgi:branched-chain amino acid transport system substrate-binding protein
MKNNTFRNQLVLSLSILAVAAAVTTFPKSPAAQEKVVKIGYIGPLTGPNTSIGIGTRNSLELALRHANERKALSYKLELVSETDDSKPSVGVAAVQKMCADPNIIAVSAHWNSNVALATNSYFEECGMLNLIAGTGSNKITESGHKAVGRVATPFKAVLPFLAEQAYNNLQLRRVAIVKSRDDYGKDVASEFRAHYEKLGGKILTEEEYNIGERDFSAILTKVRLANPDAVFLAGLSTEAALVVKQMRQLGMKQLYLGHPGWQSEAFVKAAGSEGEGSVVVTMSPFPEEIPGGPQFVKAYGQAGFKEPYDSFGVFGYVAGEVLVELLKRHGPDRKALINGLRQITKDKPVNTILGTGYFDADGELQPKASGLAVLKAGEWLRYQK